MPFKTKINWEAELDKMIAYGREDHTLQDIGDLYGVSRQRIKQVFQKFGVDPTSVGMNYRTKRSRETIAARYWLKWGDKDQQLYGEKRQKYRAKKANAKRVGTPFTLEFSDLTWPTHCPVLGIELNYLAEGKQENSVSFDRIDPAQGYILGNVVVVSWRANRIKNDGTPEEHQLIADFYK